MKKKLLASILLSAMLLSGMQVFAQKLDAPVASEEDLMTFSGIEFEKSSKDGTLIYKILESSKEGSEDIYQKALEENNRRIEKLWDENALSKFAEKEKLNIDFNKANYGLVQFNCTVSDITVDELSSKLKHQVIKKTDKSHQHDWIYFDVTDQNKENKLFRHCQTCEKWQAYHLD